MGDLGGTKAELGGSKAGSQPDKEAAQEQEGVRVPGEVAHFVCPAQTTILK